MCFLLLYRFFFRLLTLVNSYPFFNILESKMEEKDCPICLDSLHDSIEDIRSSASSPSNEKVCSDPKKRNVVKRLECGHTFHETCISSWFETNEEEQTCPVCRSSVCKDDTRQPVLSTPNNREETFDQGSSERVTALSELEANPSLGRLRDCIYFFHILFSFINIFFYLYVNGGELVLVLYSLILISPNICFFLVGTTILLQQMLCIPSKIEMLIPCFTTLCTGSILVFLHIYNTSHPFLSAFMVHTLGMIRREQADITA